MRLLIATHRRDPDGICSAAILVRFAQRENHHPYELFFCDYVTLERDFQLIQQQMSNDAFLALIDLGLDTRLWLVFHTFLETARREETPVYWGDHHVWPEEYIPKVRALGVELDHRSSEEAVSTEIVYQRFLPQDVVARRLSTIARDHDLFLQNDPIAMGLADVISYYDFLDNGAVKSPRLTRLVLDLAEGIFWNEQLKADRKEYIAKKTQALDQSIASAREVSLEKFRVVFFYADPLLSSTTAGNFALKHFSSDLSIGLWPDGRIGFRRANEALDCAAIASLFGGGGHAFAAGAEWPNPISKQTFSQIVQELLTHLKSSPLFKEG